MGNQQLSILEFIIGLKMKYKFTFNKLPEKIIIYNDTDNTCFYNGSYRKLRFSKSNNNSFFSFKVLNFGNSNYKKIQISLSKIKYAIKYNISNLDELNNYCGIYNDDFNNEYEINNINELESFLSTKMKPEIINLDNEIWKKINTLQYVSNFGRVKNIFNKEIIPKINKNGYCDIRTPNRGYARVHRLVMEAFMPLNEEERKLNLQVNHKDYNRQNNCLSNLEWVTASENIKHSLKNPNRKNKRKEL